MQYPSLRASWGLTTTNHKKQRVCQTKVLGGTVRITFLKDTARGLSRHPPNANLIIKPTQHSCHFHISSSGPNAQILNPARTVLQSPGTSCKNKLPKDSSGADAESDSGGRMLPITARASLNHGTVQKYPLLRARWGLSAEIQNFNVSVECKVRHQSRNRHYKK